MRAKQFYPCLLALIVYLPLRAELVTPPTVDWVSIPATASVGQSVTVGVGAHANLSDNSDGNNWNAGTMPTILRITIDVLQPGSGTWTNIHDWQSSWVSPASASASFTVGASGTCYVRVQLMDGRPWYSDVYTYAISVPNPAPSITSQLSLTVNQGQSVSYTITATNSPTSFGASGLPAGLSVNTSSGLISGSIPTNGGTAGSNSTVNSTITATNSSGSDNQTLTWNLTAANITPNASVSSSTVQLGSSVVLTRDGTANFGVGWTENVIWKPDSNADVLGNMQLGSSSYTPATSGTYYYQFRLVDTYSNYLDQWISFTVTSLPAPTSFQASSVLSYSVALGWNAVTGATGYKIYRNGQLIDTATGTSYTDATAQPGTSYSYTVRATNGSEDSPDSSSVNVTTASSFEAFTPLGQ